MCTFFALIGQLLLSGGLFLGSRIHAATGEVLHSNEAELAPTLEGLPFCNDGTDKGADFSDRLLFVSTLDGRLSALDLLNEGKLQWSVETGPGPLLSSSIHTLELTSNGKLVRMIPSLNGGLYKFDRKTVEPIPFNADDLLKSSFKFSNDLVISGGTESRSYGVSTRTGQVIYECTMAGCRNTTELSYDDEHEPPQERPEAGNTYIKDDIIVIQRKTQTVRAVEARTGSERWNFSTGHHELTMLNNADCRGGSKESVDPTILDLELKVVIPDGVVCAVSKSAPNTILWRHKFDHPIVSAWRAKDKYELMSVDLFRDVGSLWNINPFPEISAEQENFMINPSLYVGMHQKQLYIQESTALMVRQSTNTQIAQTIPWKPFPAKPQSAAYVDDGTALAISDPEQEETSIAISNSVLYQSNYVDGNGFFLFAPTDLEKKDHALCSNDSHPPEITHEVQNSSSIFDFRLDADAPVKIIIISMWFWWKEILVISITTAFILNFMLRFKSEKEVVVFVERKVEVPVPMGIEAIEEEAAAPFAIRNTSRSLSESNSENFVSRFREDFDLVQCLGKGGFGVVFEVKNKLDDCHYAIKRVVLPNKPESKDRVMREVKTLAHCEHHNIVRYFHAWTETPPPGWQESQDKIWIERNCLSTSIDIETPTETSPPNSKYAPDKYKYQKHSSVQSPLWLTKFSDPSFSMPHGDADQSDSCSFIQFKADHETSVPSEATGDSFQVEFNHKNTTKSVTADSGDSLDIVFKEPSLQSTKSHHVVSIGEPMSSVTESKRQNRHKRPLSLDLSSKGNVVNRTKNDSPTETSSIASSAVSNKIYLYIQMQLCRKQSLKEWLVLNDLSTRQERIIPIFEQIVNAVEYVHLKGLIHRDLKPSNIFFSLDGHVKVGDFGLVTDSSDVKYDNENNLPGMLMMPGFRDRHTRQVGTHLYMSPEQLKGLPYDYKVDIYSLGLIFFELLVSFGTEMERICTLKDVRKDIFPNGFEQNHLKEYQLLKLMLSEQPNKRPTTFGIRARPPLKRIVVSNSSPAFNSFVKKELSHSATEISNNPDSSDNSEWHFELPPRRKDSRSQTSSSGSDSNPSQIFF